MAVVEFARNVLGIKDANSEEFASESENQVIHIMDEQKDVEGNAVSSQLKVMWMGRLYELIASITNVSSLLTFFTVMVPRTSAQMGVTMLPSASKCT